MKNMEPLQLPSDLAPSSPLLQGGKVSSRSSTELSSSEGVWLVRKGEKVRENERKCKMGGSSCPTTLLMSKRCPLLQCSRSLYTAPAKQNYKKNQNQKLLQEIKREENQKGEQKSKSQTGSRNIVAG